MQVRFKNRELQLNFEQSKHGVRAWGDVIARNYIKRIRAIQAASCFDDLDKLPQLHFHALKENRVGEFAVNLTGRARIILTREEQDGVDTLIVDEVDLEHYGQ
jgi:plasmid maintenance system killer protein